MGQLNSATKAPLVPPAIRHNDPSEAYDWPERSSRNGMADDALISWSLRFVASYTVNESDLMMETVISGGRMPSGCHEQCSASPRAVSHAPLTAEETADALFRVRGAHAV